MTNIFILLGGIALFAIVVVVLDAIGRRQRRNARKLMAPSTSSRTRTER